MTNDVAPTPRAAAPAPAAKHVSFAALKHRSFRYFFVGNATAMMADNCEHVISYWVMFQKFHSPELGGFAVISHWVPYLLLSGYAGALATRVDARRMIQLGMLLFMAVSISWGVLIATGVTLFVTGKPSESSAPAAAARSSRPSSSSPKRKCFRAFPASRRWTATPIREAVTSR